MLAIKDISKSGDRNARLLIGNEKSWIVGIV
jgi:hypothetical protein